MQRGERGVLSLGDARQETSLGVGLLKKIVAGKKEFIGRSYENCHFQRRNSAVHFLFRRTQHSNSKIDATCSVTRDSFLSVTNNAYYPPTSSFRFVHEISF